MVLPAMLQMEQSQLVRWNRLNGISHSYAYEIHIDMLECIEPQSAVLIALWGDMLKTGQKETWKKETPR